MTAKQISNQQKELGVGRALMHDISLYIYNKNYDSDVSPFTVFNDWSANCEIHPQCLDTLVNILEYINNQLKLSRHELETTLIHEGLLFQEASLYD